MFSKLRKLFNCVLAGLARSWGFLADGTKRWLSQLIHFFEKIWTRLHSKLRQSWRSFCGFCKESKYHLTPVLIAGLLFIPCLLADELSYTFRWWGTLLQVCGIITVAYGLENSRKLFGKPGFLHRLILSFLHLRDIIWKPTKNVNIITGEANITLGSSTVTAHATVAPSKDWSIEQRVDFLEKGFSEMQTRISGLDQKIGEQGSSLKKELESSMSELRDAVQDIHRKLEDAVVGGIHIEAIGLFYLVIGIIFVSIPKELAALLK